jgi:RimJ/RimL family protein N-acetyltransferase
VRVTAPDRVEAAASIQPVTTFRFYRRRPGAATAAPDIPPALTLRVWRPSWTRLPPPHLGSAVNWVWWLFHNLRIFRSDTFAAIAFERNGMLVHRSTVFPPFFRFPFMGRADVQIGDTWTEPSHRGQGLAGLAVRVALSTSPAGGDVWYIVEENNAPSIRVIEREGFALVARGTRIPRLKVRLLGYYAMNNLNQ